MAIARWRARAPLLVFLTLACVANLGAAGPPPSDSQAEAQQGVFNLLYRAPGVIDSGAAATAVHCTNLGAGNAFVMVQFVDFDGTIPCTLNGDAQPNGFTFTFASREIASLIEDEECSPGPVLDQGQALIYASASDSNDVVCSVQILDPVAATPAFATLVEVYRR